LVIFVVAVAFRLIGSSFNSVFKEEGGIQLGFISSAPSASPGYDYAGEEKYYDSSYSTASLSARNVGTTGEEAEEFEVTEYTASIETRNLDKSCSAVSALKAYDYVIFENASEYDRGCNYVFKVKKDKTEEILAFIQSLNPKDFSDNTYTIKNLVDDYTGEIDILEKKLASIDETLEKAISAYDDITDLAAEVKDVETLAKIIDSKITIIERLTQERISINSRMEKINQAKAKQIDRLEYTYFRVSILENKFIDGEVLGDSWKATLKEFVQDINSIAQDITVNLVAFLFLALQYAVYLFILLIIVKYGWQFVKRLWKK
jgi:hypothetical protein